LVHRLLADPALPELALWHLGITSDWVDAAESALRAKRSLSPHVRILGSRALVDGNLTEATRRLGEAARAAPAEMGALLLEAYALCRAGNLEEASAALLRGKRFTRDAAFQGSLAWLGQTFGLEVDVTR
jgi:Flp pilus assembly protein TadD